MGSLFGTYCLVSRTPLEKEYYARGIEPVGEREREREESLVSSGRPHLSWAFLQEIDSVEPERLAQLNIFNCSTLGNRSHPRQFFAFGQRSLNSGAVSHLFIISQKLLCRTE